MKILVTGVGGNVGQFLALELAKKYDVVGVYRSKKPGNVNYQLIQADLSKDILDLTGIDTVVHAAAGLQGTALSLTENNIYSVVNLLTSAEKAGVKRFIHLSTVSVYGNVADELREDSDRINAGVYGVTKYLAEELVQESQIEQKMVIELPRMLGPFVDLYHTKGSGFITMARKIVDNENVTCFIPNVKYNNFMHVSDLANFVELLLQQAHWNNQKVLLGAGEKLTMSEILGIMKKAINSRSKILAQPDGSTPACAKVNISSAIELGYMPMSVEQTLDRFMREMKV